VKAVTYEGYGDASVLRLSNLKKPIPGKHEVLVKIHATSVTAEDPKMRAFNHPPALKIPIGLLFGFKKPKNPVLGMEFSGLVERVGDGVVKYKVGDRVFGYTGLSFGAYAQYKCLPEKALMSSAPENLSFTQAAVMVNGPLSALVYLKKAKIKMGDDVLIYGASGSVGTAAVQLAKYFGAKVTGVCSTRNLEVVRSIGADHVIDYTCQDFLKGNKKYDIIFDTVGKTSMKDCMSRIEPNGKYLITDFGLSHVLTALYTSFLKRKKVIVASSNFHWKQEDLALFKHMAEQGRYLPVIDKTFTLETIADAHKYVESGRKVGNVAVRVD